MHAYEIYANEVYPHEMHAREMHTHEVHAYEVHDSDPSYRGEACQHLDLDLEVKGHLRIRKIQPEVCLQ
jgi:hypothetical protein